MRFRNENENRSWVPYGTTYNWTLSGGFGEKKVYAQYKNSAGLGSLVYYDTIQYVAVEPAPTPTPAPSPTPTPLRVDIDIGNYTVAPNCTNENITSSPTPTTSSNVPRGGSGVAGTTGGEYLAYSTPTVTPPATLDDEKK